MITLYSNGCMLCNVVAKKLSDEGIAFVTIKADEDTMKMLHDRGHRSMPVMRMDEWEVVREGHDCLEAIASGEV